MKIQTSSGDFELPAGFQIDFTLFSQMLNDAGSRSVPLSLPPTAQNLKLLQYSDRLDAYFKPLNEIQVVVMSGLYTAQCLMTIHSVNQVDGIEATLYMDKGSFAAQIDDKTLKDLNLGTFRHPDYDTVTEAERVQYLISFLKQVYVNSSLSAELAVFPVATGEIMKEEKINRDGVTEFVEFPFILNGFIRSQTIDTTTGEVTLTQFEGEFPRKFSIDDVEIETQTGFGMTAFIKIKYIVVTLFGNYDYLFDDDSFFDLVENSEKSIVVLNNVADAIYTGRLDYNQLLPNIPIKDFLKELETLWAGKFIVNSITKTVRFATYADWTESERVDVTDYLASPLKLTGIEFNKTELKDASDVRFKDTPGTNYIEITSDENRDIELNFIITNGDEVWRQRWIVATLNIPSVEQIVRLNTSVSIEGELEETKETSSKDGLKLVEIRKSGTRQTYAAVYNRDGTLNGAIWVKYSPAFTFPNATSVIGIRAAYAGYFSFLNHSNLPVEADTYFPLSVLLNMNLDNIYIINAVPYFIENIRFNLPYDSRQVISLRTAREYADRPGIENPASGAGTLSPVIRWNPE